MLDYGHRQKTCHEKLKKHFKEIIIMGAIGKTGDNNFLSRHFQHDSLVENIKKAKEKDGSKTQEKIDLKENKLGEIQKLQSLITRVKEATRFANPFQEGLESKSATIVSHENGISGEELLRNVKIDNSAIAGNTEISVAKVATYSDIVIGIDDMGNGLAKEGALNLDGEITLTLAGKEVKITTEAGDTFQSLLSKINSSIAASGEEFEAFELRGQDDTSFFEIRSKNTGAASSMNFAYNDNTMGASTLDVTHQKAGEDADVYVNGVRHQQASNRFANIVPGTSFEVLRENTKIDELGDATLDNLNKTTISTSADRSAAKKMITDFGDAINQLSYLVAKNKQSSGSIEDYKYRGEDGEIISFDSEDAPLRGSPLLSEAEEIVFQVMRESSWANKDKGEISSLRDLGFEMITDRREGDDFSYNRLNFQDPNAFDKGFEDNWKNVYNFFVTNTQVNPADGNKGYVQYVPIDDNKVISNLSVVGKEIKLDVKYDAAGNVESATANVASRQIQAIVKASSIPGRFSLSFGEHEPLHGINLSIQPNDANDVTESTTLIYKPGMINEVKSMSRKIISDNGRSGSSAIELSKTREDLNKYKKEIENSDKKYNEQIEELNMTLQRIQQMETDLAFQIDMIQSSLGQD